MDSTVNLSFHYRESDYVRALRAHYASRLHLRFDLALCVILAVTGVCLWPLEDMHWFGVVFLAVAVIFALMLLAAFVVIPKCIFRSEPRFQDDYTLAFSTEGIHFQTKHIDSNLQWHMYTRALVDAHSYLLYYGSRQFSLVPKRVFDNDEQRQSFEQLLAQHVSKIIRRDK